MAQVMTSHRHASVCPYCASNLNARGIGLEPVAGTFTVCWTCRNVLRVDDDLNGHRLSEDEEAAITLCPELRAVIADIRARIAVVTHHRAVAMAARN